MDSGNIKIYRCSWKWGYRCTGMTFLNFVKATELVLNDTVMMPEPRVFQFIKRPGN